MTSLFRALSQRFRRSKRHFNPDGGAAGTSEYQQGFDQPEMDSRKQCQCKVLLLDGTDMNVIIPKNATGRELYDQVFYTLDLEERDYFGLQFMDHYHVQHWLDPVKRISKQVPIGPAYTFRFRVKFYPSEPNNLREELTRYQFFLQLKQDIQAGRLECPKDIAVELAAFALQSELGDYNSAEHTPALISEFRFHPEQNEEMEIAILEKFITCRGQSPATAEIDYLNKAKWIELYGVDMHTVEGKDGNIYSLGLTPTGMLVFDGAQKIGLFLWEKIQKLDFKNRKIALVVEEDADQASGQVQLHTFVFNLSSHKACKHLWKCAIEHHTFFRLKYHKPRIAKASQLFRLGSTFRYRGRTEYENVYKDGGRLSRRQSGTFERRPSQRYGPRQSLLNKRVQLRNDFKKEVGTSVGLPVLDGISPTEGSCCTAANNGKLVLSSNGIASSDNRNTVPGSTNSFIVDKVSRVSTTNDEQTTDIKELVKSPSVSRKQYSSAKVPTPRWSESPVSAVSATATTSHVAGSKNVSQIGCVSPPRISLHDPSVTHCSASINSDKLPLWGHASSTPNATSPNTRQSLIPRNFSGSSPVTKFPESSVSSLTVSSSLCESLPSKTHTESLIASPLPSLAKTPSNKTFVVLPEKKDFQNSTVIDWHNPSAVTSSRTSSIQHPSVTNSQDGVSTISTSNTSTTESSSSKLVARSDTFTRSDQKLFEQTQCEDRSGKSNAAVPGGRLSESQSRIPHLRATKCGSAIKKPHVSSAMQTSAGSLDVVEVEDKTYRSRLPVRSSYADGSSVAASGMQGCRTSVCDEKTSASRIPIMANSVHRSQLSTQLTGQLTKPFEIAAAQTPTVSTNSRIITDL